MKNLAYLLLSIATAACVETTTEDGIDDTFVDDGKADTGGITNGSPQAIAVLRVANEKSRTELKDHGVPPLAAQNIVAVRAGDDTASVADDVTFTSLAQLDAVPYVGPMAFARLLAYANELGYLTPTPTPAQPPADLWHVAACQPLTFAQLVAKFPSGERYYDFHKPFATAARHRETCNSITGCTPWQQTGDVTMWSEHSWNTFLMPSTTRGNAKMGLLPDDAPYIWVSLTNDSSAGHDAAFECNEINASNTSTMRCYMYEAGSARELGFDAGDTQILDGRFCADGSYHFTTKLLDDQSNHPGNLAQVALYGRLF